MASDDSTVIYKDVPGFPGYRVGSDGSIWSCWRGPSMFDKWYKRSVYVHQASTPARTYLCFGLYRNGKKHTRLVHRIVLEAFVGPRPDGYECRHLDGNPFNNALSNLQWGTHEENCQDTRKMNRYAVTLTEEQVREIRKRRATGESRKSVAAAFGTSPQNVHSIVSRLSWKHVD